MHWRDPPARDLVERERELDARRAGARAHRVEPRDQRGRKRRHQAGEFTKRRRRRVEFQLPNRRDAIETAHAFQGDLVELTNIQLVERKSLRAIAKPGHQRPQFLAGRNGASDIEREMSFVRPLGLRTRKRTGKGDGRIKVEALGLQFRRYLRAAIGPPMRDRNASLDGAAVDFGLHRIDGKAGRRHGDVAAQPQRLLAAINDVAATLQPGHQRVRIRRFDVERDLELVGRSAFWARLAQRDPGGAGRTEIQPADAPGFSVAMEFGGDVLQRTSAQHNLLGGEFDLRRDRR